MYTSTIANIGQYILCNLIKGHVSGNILRGEKELTLDAANFVKQYFIVLNNSTSYM